jgi:cyclopropane-fatty-acyl-phospholipid synthase
VGAVKALARLVEAKIAAQTPGLAVRLPSGDQVGRPEAPVRLELGGWAPLAHVATGRIGDLARDWVEGRIELHGSLRDIVASAAALIGDNPAAAQRGPGAALAGLSAAWRRLLDEGRSLARHTLAADARQIQHHYDVSDAFYALWLDPRRVYSCAYWRPDADGLARAQEAKLDHICRKLMLRPGERFLDVGAGWGGLLLWAAEHYGVRATGITLSKNQHAHVQRLIDAHGLAGRVRIELRDYRQLPEREAFDKIASVGMFEHVGRARLPAYFAKLRRLLVPGGLLLNHGITAAGTRNRQLGAGIGNFIERHIFPGGELLHLSFVLATMADAGWEALDVENLRPHYARTLWAWSDALEAQLPAARALTPERTLRAYRLYLAGSAMAFERGWMSLHQVLAANPSGDVAAGAMPGAQSVYPFTRDHLYPAPCSTSSSPRLPAT